MRTSGLILTLALAGCSAAASSNGAAETLHATATAAHPVVLELFQSQGCSSCPPANANVNALADRADILALSFSVTYWDYLGWKDRFAKPEFTERQRAYSSSGHSNGVYTPQVVLNGRSALAGADRGGLDRAIRAAGAAWGGPDLSRQGNGLMIAAMRGAGPARILLVTYDPRVRQVPIRAGENSGRTLPHRNIVTAIDDVGSWNGAAQRIALPARPGAGLAQAVLLQQGPGGSIIAAQRL